MASLQILLLQNYCCLKTMMNQAPAISNKQLYELHIPLVSGGTVVKILHIH